MDLKYVVQMSLKDNMSFDGPNRSSCDVVPAEMDNLATTVPYLVIIGIALVSGSIGNCLVIASVLIDKVLHAVAQCIKVVQITL